MLEFVCGVAIVLVTQRVISWRESKNAIQGRQLDFYLSLVDRISDLYVRATSGQPSQESLEAEYAKVQLMLSVIGDTTVMEAWANFHQCIAEQGKSCDRQRLMQAAGEVTYAICCRIHGEKHRSK